MGVSYWFFNMTTFQINTKPVYQNYGLLWAKGFDTHYTKTEKIIIIEDIIDRNMWNKTDTILILPDYSYCATYVYEDGLLTEKKEEETMVISHLRISISEQTMMLSKFNDLDKKEKKCSHEFENFSWTKNHFECVDCGNIRSVEPINTQFVNTQFPVLSSTIVPPTL